MSTHVILLRHGETDWNAQRRIQGQTDTALNERGHEQSRVLVSATLGVQIDALYSSDLVRARDSAAYLAEARGLTVIPLPQLRERHLGMFQGVTGAEAQSRWPEEYARYRQRDLEQTLGDGESLRQLQRRVIKVCEELIARHHGEHIALLTHAGVIDILYRHALGRPLHAARDFEIGNASVHRFDCDTSAWRLLRDAAPALYGGTSAVE
jgi:probable phosphoglycerate mutase